MPPVLAFLLLVIACARQPESAEVREWLSVLDRKSDARRAADGENAVMAQQAYADALVAFVARYPTHHRARKAYEEVQLEYARGLVEREDYDRAVAVYENLIARNPEHEGAQEELIRARDLRHVTPAELEQVRTGMSPDEVRAILGDPPRGWTKTSHRGPRAEISWYYPRVDRRAALVFFVNGKVVRTEY
ncbi:MAG TPA: tetratricopeptide repeat protein [Thermoanaerobaculia bacterium]